MQQYHFASTHQEDLGIQSPQSHDSELSARIDFTPSKSDSLEMDDVYGDETTSEDPAGRKMVASPGRKRGKQACDYCRQKKHKCMRSDYGEDSGCEYCKLNNRVCHFSSPDKSESSKTVPAIEYENMKEHAEAMEDALEYSRRVMISLRADNVPATVTDYVYWVRQRAIHLSPELGIPDSKNSLDANKQRVRRPIRSRRRSNFSSRDDESHHSPGHTENSLQLEDPVQHNRQFEKQPQDHLSGASSSALIPHSRLEDPNRFSENPEPSIYQPAGYYCGTNLRFLSPIEGEPFNSTYATNDDYHNSNNETNLYGNGQFPAQNWEDHYQWQ